MDASQPLNQPPTQPPTHPTQPPTPPSHPPVSTTLKPSTPTAPLGRQNRQMPASQPPTCLHHPEDVRVDGPGGVPQSVERVVHLQPGTSYTQPVRQAGRADQAQPVRQAGRHLHCSAAIPSPVQQCTHAAPVANALLPRPRPPPSPPLLALERPGPFSSDHSVSAASSISCCSRLPRMRITAAAAATGEGGCELGCPFGGRGLRRLSTRSPTLPLPSARPSPPARPPATRPEAAPVLRRVRWPPRLLRTQGTGGMSMGRYWGMNTSTICGEESRAGQVRAGQGREESRAGKDGREQLW